MNDSSEWFLGLQTIMISRRTSWVLTEFIMHSFRRLCQLACVLRGKPSCRLGRGERVFNDLLLVMWLLTGGADP